MVQFIQGYEQIIYNITNYINYLDIFLIEATTRQMHANYRDAIFQKQHTTDKQISQLISQIKPKNHTDKQYQLLLRAKQKFDRERFTQSERNNFQLQPAIKKTPKDIKNMFCYCCYAELLQKKYFCRVCGNNVCSSCLTRTRRLYDDQIVKFCQKCDFQFLQAMNNKIHGLKENKLRKVFEKLIQQQQTLENLLLLEKNKSMHLEQSQTKQLVQNVTAITELKIQKRNRQVQLEEIKKKIKWGNDIYKKLKKKHKALKDINAQSFINSIDKSSDFDSQIEPPKAESELSIEIQNINESVIQSFWEEGVAKQEQNSEIAGMKCQGAKCSCQIF